MVGWPFTCFSPRIFHSVIAKSKNNSDAKIGVLLKKRETVFGRQRADGTPIFPEEQQKFSF
jgi:hypothetical protein